MNFKLETEFSKADILQEVDALKKQIDDMRPLPDDVEGRVMQKLRLDWNYHSNAIEGNRLSYGETVALLMEGITAKGKPLKDSLDIRGHNEAISFLLSIVKETRSISEADIRSLHKKILVEPYNVKAQTADGLPTTKQIALGEYKTSPNHVQTATGETHYYATPEETPAKMQELMKWYNEVSKDKQIHPVVLAALFHHKFVAIHSFDDGNGRLSRILMNLILMQKGYPPVVIKMDDRTNYYSLLSRADNGDLWPFAEYIAEQLINSLRLYLRAAKGGDIDEDEDIDMELALFNIELQNKLSPPGKVTPKEIYNITIEAISPIVRSIIEKASQFDGVFWKKKNSLTINYTDFINKRDEVYATVLNGADIAQFFNLFDRDDFRINSISLDIELLQFKNPDNIFDVTGTLYVMFKNHNYEIKNHNLELNLFKSYSDKLGNDEKKNVIARILRDIKDLIKDNIN